MHPGRRLFTTMCSDASAGEFALFNIRFLKTAITVKDNIIRLTQRFVLLDEMDSTLCQSERISQQALEKWKGERTAKSVEMDSIMTTDKTVRKVESIIAEIESEISETMNSLPEGKSRLQKQPLEDANVSLEHSNSCVKEMKGTKTVEGEDEPHVYDMETEYRNAERRSEEHQEDSNAQEFSDEVYLLRLICENSIEEEEKEVNIERGSQADYQPKRSIQDFIRDLEDLGMVYAYSPLVE
ncbi:unnamed protein product [Haemonchus placei]|uniref:Rx_N domain-containing protein n=1 Tax=Haemonchus placei TaxID=6290 RepID=A0A0N4VUS2_HAEPC|nr:unnamed protein product [Haemonchus placei]